MKYRKLTRRGRVRYLVRWRDASGRQRWREFEQEGDAILFVAQEEHRRRQGAHAPGEASRETLATWIGHWWDRDQVHRPRSTREQRASALNKWVLPYVGSAPLCELGPRALREWRSLIIRDGASAKRANAVVRVLSAVLGAAVEDDLLPANPCRRVKPLPVDDPERWPIEPEDLERIRRAVPGPRDALLVSLLAYAGIRPEEALALRWIDAEDGVLAIERVFCAGELRRQRKSGGPSRTVPIVAPLAADLAALRPASIGREDLVVPGLRGQPLNWRNWSQRAWAPAREAAGLQAVPYECRNTCATLLINEGHAPPFVAAWLGHASSTTTLEHYARWFDAARVSPRAPMVEVIEAARRSTGTEDVCQMGANGAVRVLRQTARDGR